MGLLWTTEGTRRIVNTLNTAFDGPNKGLQTIRDGVAADSFLKGLVSSRKWNPGDLAQAFDLLPYDQGNDSGAPQPIRPKHRLRWLYFLNRIIGANATVFASLRDALADAILNQDSKGNPLSIVRVTFDHVELEDSSASANVVIFDLANADKSATVRHITLFTVPVPQNLAPEPLEASKVRRFMAKPPWQKP
jgi:hypothetical protein